MSTDIEDIATRGELLHRAEEAVQHDDRVLFSLRRTLPVVGWSVALAVAAFTDTSSDGIAEVALVLGVGLLWWLVARLIPRGLLVSHLAGGMTALVVGVVGLPIAEGLDLAAARAAFLVVWAAIATGMLAATWRYVTQSIGHVESASRWTSARREPSSFELDHSDVTADVATVQDVSDRPDFESTVGQIVARHHGRHYSFDTLKPALFLTVTGVVGLVLVLVSLTASENELAWADGLCGGLLLVPYGWALIGNLRSAVRRRQDEANRVVVEARLFGIRRDLASGVTTRPPRRPSLLGTPGGLLLLIGWTGVLIIRVRTSSGLAIVIAAGIVLVASAAVITLAVIRSRQTRVFPLAGRGDSVLQEPVRQVTLTIAGDSLQIADPSGRSQPHSVPVGDVLAVEPLTGLSALSRRGVGIVTKGSPIVLAGSRVIDDPAIVALKKQL